MLIIARFTCRTMELADTAMAASTVRCMPMHHYSAPFRGDSVGGFTTEIAGADKIDRHRDIHLVQ